MLTPNRHYAELQDSYLFARIAEKTKAYLGKTPERGCCAWASGMCPSPSARR